MSQISHGGEHSGGHVLPLRVYFGVFAALVFLTLVTVGVSYANLGPRALIVAMGVALVKAGLVIGYFMHLKFESRFYSLVFFSSLIFLVIFFGFTFIDLGTRDRMLPEQETFAKVKEKALQELSDSPAGKLPPAERDPALVRPEAAPMVNLPSAPAPSLAPPQPALVPPGAQGVAPGAPAAPGSAVANPAIEALRKRAAEAVQKMIQEQHLKVAPSTAPAPAHP